MGMVGLNILFRLRLGMDYIKNVVNPIRQVAPRDSSRGLREDYRHVNAGVILLEGEIHYERKPIKSSFAVLVSFLASC